MNVWKFIAEKFSGSIQVILLYVLQSEGSSPGRQGFAMAVAADDTFSGTIGGGIMEHKFVEMAKAALQMEYSKDGLYKQVHDKSAAKNQSGMICSGEQTIFLYHVQAKDFKHIQHLIHSFDQHANGTLQLTSGGIEFMEEPPASDYYFEQISDIDFLYREKTGYKNYLHIIGGGHCALAFSKLMREMDFYIRVYDERKGLNTFEQNEYAHERIPVSSYEELSALIESGANVYVVIMTFGYRTDDIALKALLDKQFKYMGMLGSKKKMEKLFAGYKDGNTNAGKLENVYAPIGIQIKSQTTFEIAVSIAAQIIAVKNGAPL
jgi:xanthine dehydrogenase accessory factor